jgi:hypothetical protein
MDRLAESATLSRGSPPHALFLTGILYFAGSDPRTEGGWLALYATSVPFSLFPRDGDFQFSTVSARGHDCLYSYVISLWTTMFVLLV